MEPLTIGLIVAACAFGGAIFGMVAGKILPEHHLSDASKDVVKVAMAMTATMAALLISLMVSSAKSSFDDKDDALRQQAARTIMLDRLLAQYGPQTEGIRASLRMSAEDMLRTIWHEKADSNDVEIDLNSLRQRRSGIESVQEQIFNLTPENDKQRDLKAQAISISFNIAEGHWQLVEQLEGRLQWAFLGMVMFWLTIVFVSFGVFAPRNASVIAALFVGAVSVGAAIYMIAELDSPYGGLITISSAPMHAALEQLGR
ncbi:MAG: hypothetical protein AB7M05_06600 [Alphaproteobacteria bacterium]